MAATPALDQPRRTEYVRLDALRPAVRNPKTHILGEIIGSIQRFGLTGPVLMCERVERLAAGHGRTAALVNMKEHGDPVPGGILLDEDGEWMVPVTRGWASRDDTELEAYIIADNKLTENGGWDHALTAEMLHDIHSADPELFELVGFDADELDELLRRTDVDAWSEEDTDASITVEDEPAAGTPRPELVDCPECGHTFAPKDA